MGKICKGISVFIKVVFGMLCIFWIYTVICMAYPAFGGNQLLEAGVSNNFALVLHLGRGVVIAVIFAVLINMFSDSGKGKTPFRMLQVKRLRSIAGLLVVYTVIDFAFSYNSVLIQLGEFSAGYISISDSSNVIMPLNFAPTVAAAVVFAFSFVFKYGVLLQEFSDDTI